VSIKRILVPLTGYSEATETVMCALTLAQRLHAHVTVTETTVGPTPYIDSADVTGLAYVETMKAMEAARTQAQSRARRCFDTAVAATKVMIADRPAHGGASVAWVDSAPFGGNVISQLGRMSDLVVARRPSETGLADVDVLETAIFAVRRPVLLVPPQHSAMGAGIAVAWNGSLEAADALERAVDVHVPGGAVTLIQVGELPVGGVAVEEAVNYLGWHGVKATVKTVADQPKATAQVLMREAKAAGAGLLVMGAYTHSRLREMVFGGVTAHMITKSEMPVLLAH